MPLTSEPAKAAGPALFSCKGLCSAEAHPLWNCLCLLPFPVVLIYNSFALLTYPMVMAYFRRLWAVLVRVYFGLFGSMACMGLYEYYDTWNLGASSEAAALGDCDDFKGAELNKKIDWVRAAELVQPGQKPMQLFSGRIEASDLLQGSLGDCWLVAALAVIAENPAAIRACIRESEINPRGKYHVRLYDGRKCAWETVVVDDRFPCSKGTKTPYFMKPHVDNGIPELWAILLEKAFAKFCGSYGELEGGNARWAWHALTGDNVFSLSKDDPRGLSWSRSTIYFPEEGKRRTFYMRDTEDKLGYSDFFGVLSAYHARKCAMGASIHNKPHNGKELERTDGLVEGHAYSILQLHTAGQGVMATLQKMGVKVGESKTHEMIRLRNPWGSTSWTGAWGRGSSLWDAFPEVAKELKYNKDSEDDGSFWMTINDFTDIFEGMDICDRNTKGDLALNLHEEKPMCGPCYGHTTGCFKYWCKCRGLRVIYCGRHSSSSMIKKDPCPCCGSLVALCPGDSV